MLRRVATGLKRLDDSLCASGFRFKRFEASCDGDSPQNMLALQRGSPMLARAACIEWND
jgi:hypothetical protein